MTEEEYNARMKPKLGNTPGSDVVSNVGMRVPGVNILRSDIAAAIARTPRLPVRKNGIFRHPNDWTEEEDAVIIELLRAKVPLYIIAQKVNCERHALVKHINSMPDIMALREDMDEAKLDDAEYQMGRLITQGNPTMIMWFLDQKGGKRGYGLKAQTEGGEGGGEQRIVMGSIPAEAVEEADKYVESVKGEESKVAELDPQTLAKIQEDAAANEERIAEAETPQEGGEAEHGDVPPFMIDGDIPSGFEDAEHEFADGEFSPFGL